MSSKVSSGGSGSLARRRPGSASVVMAYLNGRCVGEFDDMTVTRPPSVAAACERARAHLLELQHEDGWWKGEAATNVTMDAEDLLMRQFLGIREAEATEESARWIRSQQSPEGFWANFHGGPADLSTTVEAYTALRVAGDPADATHLRRARDFILDCGGLRRPGCSPGSGWRCSANGPGTPSPSYLPRQSSCHLGFRSTSTPGPVGLA